MPYQSKYKRNNYRSKGVQAFKDGSVAFLKHNRHLLDDDNKIQVDAQLQVNTARAAKRVRELVREFPDFYFAPGKKKFQCVQVNTPTLVFPLGRGMVLDKSVLGHPQENANAGLVFVLYLVHMFVDIACRCWNDEIVSWGDSGIDFNESQYPKTNWQEKNYEANPMYAENNNANSLSATDVYQLTQLIGRFDVDAYANGKTRVANLYGKDLKFNVWVAPGSDPNVQIDGAQFDQAEANEEMKEAPAVEGTPVIAVVFANHSKTSQFNFGSGASLYINVVEGFTQLSEQSIGLQEPKPFATGSDEEMLAEMRKTLPFQIAIQYTVKEPILWKGEHTAVGLSMRYYALSTLVQAADGMLDSYEWYKEHGFQLLHDKMTLKLQPVQTIRPRSTHGYAADMARKYAPTMYFVDYDDYMLAKMGIKLNDKSKEQAFDERKGLTRWLTDSFIFLVPVHYRVTPEEFLRTTDAALAIMKELEGSGRLIAGKNLTQAEKKELVTQYFQQIGEQHEFFKPTRTIKNIQYLRGIYCCFTSSGDVSQYDPRFRIQSNPIYIRKEYKPRIRMFQTGAFVGQLNHNIWLESDAMAVKAKSPLLGAIDIAKAIGRNFMQGVSYTQQVNAVQKLMGLQPNTKFQGPILSEVTLAQIYRQIHTRDQVETMTKFVFGSTAFRLLQVTQMVKTSFDLASQGQLYVSKTANDALRAKLLGFAWDWQIDNDTIKTVQQLTTILKGHRAVYDVLRSKLPMSNTFINDLVTSGNPFFMERVKNMLGYTRKGYKFNGAGTKNLAITKLGMYNPTQIVTASLEDGVIDFGKSDMTVAAPIRDHVMLAQGFLKGFVKSYTVASKYCGSSVLAVEYLMAAYNHVLLTGSDKQTVAVLKARKVNFSPQNSEVALLVDNQMVEPDAQGKINDFSGMPLNSDPVKKMIGLDIALKRFKLKSEPYTKAALVAERAAYEHSTMADARYQQSAYLFGPDELKELRQDGTQIVLTNLLDTWSAALSNAQGGDVKSKVTKMHLLYFTSVFSVLHMLIEFYLHGVHRGVSDWALYRIIMNFQRYLVWVCLWGYLNCDRTDIQWQVIQNLMSGDIVPPPQAVERPNLDVMHKNRAAISYGASQVVNRNPGLQLYPGGGGMFYQQPEEQKAADVVMEQPPRQGANGLPAAMLPAGGQLRQEDLNMDDNTISDEEPNAERKPQGPKKAKQAGPRL